MRSDRDRGVSLSNISFSCGTVVSVALTTIIFNCDGFIGRYVNIFLPGQDKILTLCEVEVFTSILPTIDTLLKPKTYPPSAHEREKLTTTNTPSLKGKKQPPSFGKETTPQSTKGTKIPSIPGTTIQPRTGKKGTLLLGANLPLGTGTGRLIASPRRGDILSHKIYQPLIQFPDGGNHVRPRFSPFRLKHIPPRLFLNGMTSYSESVPSGPRFPHNWERALYIHTIQAFQCPIRFNEIPNNPLLLQRIQGPEQSVGLHMLP